MAKLGPYCATVGITEELLDSNGIIPKVSNPLNGLIIELARFSRLRRFDRNKVASWVSSLGFNNDDNLYSAIWALFDRRDTLRRRKKSAKIALLECERFEPSDWTTTDTDTTEPMSTRIGGIMATLIPNTGTRSQLCLPMKKFQEKLCNNLYSMWRNSQLCDLTLKVSDDKTISVHSCLLAAFSPTILDILSRFDAQEKAQSNKIMEVNVESFSLPVMTTILSTIYTGWLFVKSADILRDILDACRWLKIQDLVSVVEGAMEERGIPSDIVSNSNIDRDASESCSSGKDIFVNSKKNTEQEMETDSIFTSTSLKTPVSNTSGSSCTEQISLLEKDLRLQPSNVQKDSSNIVTTSLSSVKDSNSNTLPANSEKLQQNGDVVELSFSDDLVSREEILSPVPTCDSVTQISDAMSNRIKQVFCQGICEDGGNLEETWMDSNLSEFNSINSESITVFSNISSASKSPENSGVSNSNLRKSTRKRKKLQKWEESFVTKNVLSSSVNANSNDMINTETGICKDGGSLEETWTDTNPSEFNTSLHSESNNVFSNISSASGVCNSNLRKSMRKRKKLQKYEESFVTKNVLSSSVNANSDDMINTETGICKDGGSLEETLMDSNPSEFTTSLHSESNNVLSADSNPSEFNTSLHSESNNVLSADSNPSEFNTSLHSESNVLSAESNPSEFNRVKNVPSSSVNANSDDMINTETGICKDGGSLEETWTDSNPSEFNTSLHSESNNVLSAESNPSEFNRLKNVPSSSVNANSDEMINTDRKFVHDIKMDFDVFNRYLLSRDTQIATTTVANSEVKTDNHEQARDVTDTNLDVFHDHIYNNAAETNDSIQMEGPSEDEILSSPLICDKCGLKFYKKKCFEKHIHPVYSCFFCSAKFYQKIQLFRHIDSMHSQTNDTDR